MCVGRVRYYYELNCDVRRFQAHFIFPMHAEHSSQTSNSDQPPGTEAVDLNLYRKRSEPRVQSEAHNFEFDSDSNLLFLFAMFLRLPAKQRKAYEHHLTAEH